MTTRILYNRLLWLGSLGLALGITAAIAIPIALAVGIRLASLILGG